MEVHKSSKLTPMQRVALTSLMLAGIVSDHDRSPPSIANHAVSQALGLRAAAIGLLLSALPLAYACAHVPIGAMLDRFGARAMLGIGALGMLGSADVAAGLRKRGMSPIRNRKRPICAGLLGAGALTIPAANAPSTILAILYISVAMAFVYLASGGTRAVLSMTNLRRPASSPGSLQNFDGYLGDSLASVITDIVSDRPVTHALLISAAVAIAAALVSMFVVINPIAIAAHAD